jgi:hypothetical protein
MKADGLLHLQTPNAKEAAKWVIELSAFMEGEGEGGGRGEISPWRAHDVRRGSSPPHVAPADWSWSC